jgi:hypothetical protein
VFGLLMQLLSRIVSLSASKLTYVLTGNKAPSSKVPCDETLCDDIDAAFMNNFLLDKKDKACHCLVLNGHKDVWEDYHKEVQTALIAFGQRVENSDQFNLAAAKVRLWDACLEHPVRKNEGNGFTWVKGARHNLPLLCKSFVTVVHKMLMSIHPTILEVSSPD